MDDRTFDLLKAELDRIQGSIKNLDTEMKASTSNLSDVKIEIAKIQTKSSIAGSIAGFVTSALVAIGVSFKN